MSERHWKRNKRKGQTRILRKHNRVKKQVGDRKREGKTTIEEERESEPRETKLAFHPRRPCLLSFPLKTWEDED